ncbi:transketolase, partial [bacterium LRH843]|nr:transketolase [bacterium LRH843]
HFAAYESANPELAADLLRRLQGWLPDDWPQRTKAFIHQTQVDGKEMATRKASAKCLDYFGPMLPELVGGSADLSGSNCTEWAESK